MDIGEKWQCDEQTYKEAPLHAKHPIRLLAKSDLELQNKHGVRFLLCVVQRPFKPVGVISVEAKTRVAELRTIRDLEIHNGTKWVPFDISGEYLNFLMDTKQDSPLNNEDEIGKAGQVVSVRVADQYKYNEEWIKKQQGDKEQACSSASRLQETTQLVTKAHICEADQGEPAAITARNQKAAASTMSPLPKRNSECRSERDTLLRPKTQAVKPIAKMAPIEVWDKQIISTFHYMTENAIGSRIT